MKTDIKKFKFSEDKTKYTDTGYKSFSVHKADFIYSYTNKINHNIYVEAIIVIPWSYTTLFETNPDITIVLTLVINCHKIWYKEIFKAKYHDWFIDDEFIKLKWFEKYLNQFDKNINKILEIK